MSNESMGSISALKLLSLKETKDNQSPNKIDYDIYSILPEARHPDLAYLGESNFADVLSMSLAVLFEEQPIRPITFLSNWLLKFEEGQKCKNDLLDKDKFKKYLLKIKKRKYKEQLQKEAEEKEKEDKHQEKINKFKKEIEDSKDLIEKLDLLCDFLNEEVNATGTYIGKIEKMKKIIEENDFENAHIDESAPLIIRYLATCKSHRGIMYDRRVKAEDTLTYSIFKTKEVSKEESADKEEIEKGAVDEIKEILIPEVVRETRMKYYKVPRLGCYFARALEYKSCLQEEFLDSAFENYFVTVQKREEQGKAKADKEEEIQREKQEKEEAGEEYIPQDMEWPIIEEPLFDHVTENFVLCLDTLGQDREFSEKQKQFIREIIDFYVKQWETKEISYLNSDKLLRIEKKKSQEEYIENNYKELLQQIATEEGELMDNTEIEMTEDNKEMYKSLFHSNTLIKKLVEGPLREEINDLRKYHILKFKRIFQALFYFMGYKKEEICEPETNRIMWKKANLLVDDNLFKKIKDYNPLGEKIIPNIRKYNLINHVEALIEDYDVEEVQKYSLAFSLLLSWMKDIINVRKQDIKARKEYREKLIEERNQAIEQEQARLKKREEDLQAAIEEAKANWKPDESESKAEVQEEEVEEDIYHYLEEKEEKSEEKKEEKKQEFIYNSQEFLTNFDEENPPVEIPPEVKEERDDDFEFS